MHVIGMSFATYQKTQIICGHAEIEELPYEEGIVISMENNEITKDTSNFLRGMAALLVIVAHYAQWCDTQMNIGLIGMLLCKLGRYGVSIFFVISGYGLVRSVTAKGEISIQFLKSRLMNTYIPYLLISAVMELIHWQKPGPKWVLNWLLCINKWFIAVIMLFYILFYLSWKYSKYRVQVIELGVFIISVVLAVITRNDVWWTSNISFGLGVLIGVCYEPFSNIFMRHKIISIGLFAIGFIGCAVIYAIADGQSQFVFLLFKVLASATWAVLVMGGAVLYQPAWGRVFRAIGRSSLECYLIHETVLALVQRLRLGAVMTAIAAGISAIAASFIIHKALTGMMRKNAG